MALQREAWQCSGQNRVSEQRMECHLGSWVDCESQRIKKLVLSTQVAELYHFMKCFSSWIMEGTLRWGCKNPHENWCEEPGNYRKNNSPRWTKGNHPHDLYVAKGSLFRKYSCSHSNLKLLGRCLTKASAKADNLITVVQTRKLLDVDKWSTRPSCQPGVKTFSTHKGQIFFLNTLKISCTTFQVMFAGTQHTKEQKEIKYAWAQGSRYHEFHNCICRLPHQNFWWEHCVCARFLWPFSSVFHLLLPAPSGVRRVNRWTRNAEQRREKLLLWSSSILLAQHEPGFWWGECEAGKTHESARKRKDWSKYHENQ